MADTLFEFVAARLEESTRARQARGARHGAHRAQGRRPRPAQCHRRPDGRDADAVDAPGAEARGRRARGRDLSGASPPPLRPSRRARRSDRRDRPRTSSGASAAADPKTRNLGGIPRMRGSTSVGVRGTTPQAVGSRWLSTDEGPTKAASPHGFRPPISVEVSQNTTCAHDSGAHPPATGVGPVLFWGVHAGRSE